MLKEHDDVHVSQGPSLSLPSDRPRWHSRTDVHSVLRFVFPSLRRIPPWLTSPSLPFSCALLLVVAETKVACVRCQNWLEGERTVVL